MVIWYNKKVRSENVKMVFLSYKRAKKYVNGIIKTKNEKKRKRSKRRKRKTFYLRVRVREYPKYR